MLYVSYAEYQINLNQSFPINYDIFWLSFLKNVTSVKDVNIDMNYLEKSFQYKSTFVPSGRDIAFDMSTLGLNKNNICTMTIQELDLDGNLKQSWGSSIRGITKLTLKNDPKTTIVSLNGACSLDEEIPNGYVDVKVSNFTKKLIINQTTFSVHFDDSKFGCRENCLFNEQLRVTDADTDHNIRSVTMKGEEIDTKSLQFDIRTYDKTKSFLSNFWFVFIISLLFMGFQIAYDLYKDTTISEIKGRFKKS